MSNRCRDPFDLYNAPAGSGTARRFPWWQTGLYTRREVGGVVMTIDAGDRFRFRPFGPVDHYRSGASPGYNNPFSWPIYITEVRFLISINWFPESFRSEDYEDLGRQIGIRMTTTNRGDILKEFVPMSALATEPHAAQEFEMSGATITLPDDYFLPSDADFEGSLDLIMPDILAGEAEIQMGIRGCDPHNKSAVARFSEYQTVGYGLTLTDQAFNISGTAGGQSLRNMWMRDLTFAMNTPFGTGIGSKFWDIIAVRVTPPQGPKWTTDISTPISCLSDQFPVGKSVSNDSAEDLYQNGRRSTIVSHKPVTPYLLMPQDKLDIEGTFLTDLELGDNNVRTDIFATVRGYQEAPDVG